MTSDEKLNRRWIGWELQFPLDTTIPIYISFWKTVGFLGDLDLRMMEKLKSEQFPLSPSMEGCGSPPHDTAPEEGDACGKQEGTTAETGEHHLPEERRVLNGVAKETAHHATELKKEVAVIELSRRGGSADIKGRELKADISHKVQTTELCRPPIPLPLPPRDPLSDTRMVQLSPPAFPLPARAMLYSNMTQPLATINR